MDQVFGYLAGLCHQPVPILCGAIAGAIATAVIFASRLISDDLAAYLFDLSHHG